MQWHFTAVVIAYDDSDGWYDHQPSPIVNPSQSPQDASRRATHRHVRLSTPPRWRPHPRPHHRHAGLITDRRRLARH
ncbi:MAG: alkaline phosphatase family protein [Pseudonocardiaceae bacterium]